MYFIVIQDGNTALMKAAANGHLAVGKLLLIYKAIIDAENQVSNLPYCSNDVWKDLYQ